MTIIDILKESWLSISGNKLRSFLTVLGMVTLERAEQQAKA